MNNVTVRSSLQVVRLKTFKEYEAYTAAKEIVVAHMRLLPHMTIAQWERGNVVFWMANEITEEQIAAAREKCAAHGIKDASLFEVDGVIEITPIIYSRELEREIHRRAFG